MLRVPSLLSLSYFSAWSSRLVLLGLCAFCAFVTTLAPVGYDAITSIYLTKSQTVCLADSGSSTQRARRTYIAVRTFAGAKRTCSCRLLQTASAFVFLSDTLRLVFVLDAESSDDHVWGDELLQRFSAEAAAGHVSVSYRAAPPTEVVRFHPFRPFIDHEVSHGSDGYSRQLFDTFFLDEHIPDACPDDLIAIVDSDSTFNAVFAPDALFSEDGKILMTAFFPNHYAGDSVLLNDSAPYDVMFTDSFPQPFLLRTFRNARDHISRTHVTMTAAWLHVRAEAFRRKAMLGISPVNVLANYALLHERHSYAVALRAYDARTVEYAGGVACAPVFAGHSLLPDLVSGWPGCCQGLGVAGCSPGSDAMTDETHLQYGNAIPPCSPDASEAMARRTYHHIHRVVSQASSNVLASHRAACEIWRPGVPTRDCPPGIDVALAENR